MVRPGDAGQPGGRCCLPKPVNLARHANRSCQKLRPNEPEDLHFEIDRTYVPESFIQDDMTVTGRRHIVLASEPMLSLLGKAHWLVLIPHGSCKPLAADPVLIRVYLEHSRLKLITSLHASHI